MSYQDSLKIVLAGELHPAFSLKTQKRWSGTIGRLLYKVIEVDHKKID